MNFIIMAVTCDPRVENGLVIFFWRAHTAITLDCCVHRLFC
jgi:hypothetical protein